MEKAAEEPEADEEDTSGNGRVRTMQALAAVSGISRPTLSKYFHDPDSVRPTTRQRIEWAVREHDYRPNHFAMNLNRKATKAVGIIVPYLADPFFAELARCIERRCIDAGYRPVLYSAHGERDFENSALDSLRSLKPAGVLMAPLGSASDIGELRRFAEDIPTVLFDSELEAVGEAAGEAVGEAFVGSDNFQSIGLIVDYLCRTGEPPCFLEMPPVNPNATTRRHAYVQAMERLGFVPRVVKTEVAGWDFERIGFEEGKRLIAERGLPSDTVLCSNDRIAIGLLAAAYEKGLRVGHGPGSAMRIAGHDDHPWSRFTCPPLTTVSQDYEGIAERSVAALFAIIDPGSAPPPPRSVKLEGRLIMRASA